MELDQRIKTLELELKILKNEIHQALGEVQKQILAHYFLTEAAVSAPAPSAGIAQSFEAIEERTMEAEEPPDFQQAQDTDAAFPVVQVTLDQVRTSPPSPRESLEETRERLSEWVADTEAKIGAGRTRELIDVCGRKGYLAPDVKEIVDVILKLAPTADVANLAKPVSANEILTALLNLNQLLGQEADIDAALELIEGANFG